MDINKIEELIQVLQGSKSEEICVSKGEFKVLLRKSKRSKTQSKPTKASSKCSGKAEAKSDVVNNNKMVTSPMVGIFHIKEDLKGLNTEISQGQVVGSIESMKLLNDVVANCSGKISEIYVEDGIPVEYGQPLFRVEAI